MYYKISWYAFEQKIISEAKINAVGGVAFGAPDLY
jgi:hypothetical protein